MTLPPTEPATTMMRAVIQTGYGSTDVWHLGDITRPTPGKGEVLLTVSAAGIDRGTWHLMVGLPKLLRLFFGLRRPRRPVPGLDVAGEVIAVGSKVTRFSPGDVVFGVAQGSLAEHAVAREDKLALAPDDATGVEAAVLGISGMTAIQALDAGRVSAGQRVLIIGASGGVGSFAVKLAVARAAVVTAVCGAAKASAVIEWGAERVIDHASEDVTAEDATYDVIVDIAGGTSLPALRRILTPTGTIVFVGDDSGGQWTGGYGRPMRHAVRMLASRQRYVMLAARELGADLERLATLVDSGDLRPHVHAAYPLDDVASAMGELAAGRVCGKVAVVVSS